MNKKIKSVSAPLKTKKKRCVSFFGEGNEKKSKGAIKDR